MSVATHFVQINIVLECTDNLFLYYFLSIEKRMPKVSGYAHNIVCFVIVYEW